MLNRGWQQVEGTGNRASAGRYSTEEAWGFGGVRGSEARQSSHRCYRVKPCRRVRAGVNRSPQEMKSAKFGGLTIRLEMEPNQA